MANPRKFSEKIALHKQKQAEETAAFERIMQMSRAVGMPTPPLGSPAHLNPHSHGFIRPYLSGSLPNVNVIATNPQLELQQQPTFDESKHQMRHPTRYDSRIRPYGYIHKRAVEFTNRQRMGNYDGPRGQYPGHYLSPPSESNWRRTNSDSALHQSVMNPNQQDPFNSSSNQMHHQDLNENSSSNMPFSYKTMLDNKKIDQYPYLGNRPKSCEAPNMSLFHSDSQSIMRTAPDGSPLSTGGNVPVITVSVTPSLSHMTQLGANTGSCPDLTNLRMPTLPNPIRDYDESHLQSVGQNSTMYSPTHNMGNVGAGSVVTSHLGGLSRSPASPNRSRRHNNNVPSPLSFSSLEHARRIKYPNVTSPKIAGIKSEMKSPPLAGNYSYPYPPPPPGQQGGNWPLSSSDHPGSPSHGQLVSQRGMSSQGGAAAMHSHQISSQHSAGSHPLQVDVSAASKIQQTTYGGVSSMTSPLTSPTSPSSQCSQPNFSPLTSPRHEFTTGCNPTLSQAYYGAESSMQPLQYQFEQFNVVGDNGTSPHHSAVPQMYSKLTAFTENSSDYNPEMIHGDSGSLSRGLHSLNSLPEKHSLLLNSSNRISPHIVLTDADDIQSSKVFSGGSDLNILGHDLGTEYFPGDELKANLGLEELQMLEDSNIITDPVMEDSLH